MKYASSRFEAVVRLTKRPTRPVRTARAEKCSATVRRRTIVSMIENSSRTDPEEGEIAEPPDRAEPRHEGRQDEPLRHEFPPAVPRAAERRATDRIGPAAAQVLCDPPRGTHPEQRFQQHPPARDPPAARRDAVEAQVGVFVLVEMDVVAVVDPAIRLDVVQDPVGPGQVAEEVVGAMAAPGGWCAASWTCTASTFCLVPMKTIRRIAAGMREAPSQQAQTRPIAAEGPGQGPARICPNVSSVKVSEGSPGRSRLLGREQPQQVASTALRLRPFGRAGNTRRAWGRRYDHFDVAPSLGDGGAGHRRPPRRDRTGRSPPIRLHLKADRHHKGWS